MPNSVVSIKSDDCKVNKLLQNRRVTVSTIGSYRGRNSRIASTASEKVSQWEYLMRKFSLDAKRSEFKCSFAAPEVVQCQTRPLKTFTTGSTYEGTWDTFGMCGFGTYTFPDGVVYKGEFESNVFHGDGLLKYTDGTMVKGKWDHGELVESTIVFPDGILYKENDWEYCTPSDRRFASEYYDGIQPAGASYMTEPHPPVKIPPGLYDTGDGFFDPVTDLVYRKDDPTAVVRSIRNGKQWVLDNCRSAPDGPIGPGHHIYEEWQEPQLDVPYPPAPRVISEEEISTESLFYDVLQHKMTDMSSWVKPEDYFNYDPEESPPMPAEPPKRRGRSQTSSHGSSRAATRSPSISTTLGLMPRLTDYK